MLKTWERIRVSLKHSVFGPDKQPIVSTRRIWIRIGRVSHVSVLYTTESVSVMWLPWREIRMERLCQGTFLFYLFFPTNSHCINLWIPVWVNLKTKWTDYINIVLMSFKLKLNLFLAAFSSLHFFPSLSLPFPIWFSPAYHGVTMLKYAFLNVSVGVLLQVWCYDQLTLKQCVCVRMFESFLYDRHKQHCASLTDVYLSQHSLQSTVFLSGQFKLNTTIILSFIYPFWYMYPIGFV